MTSSRILAALGVTVALTAAACSSPEGPSLTQQSDVPTAEEEVTESGEAAETVETEVLGETQEQESDTETTTSSAAEAQDEPDAQPVELQNTVDTEMAEANEQAQSAMLSMSADDAQAIAAQNAMAEVNAMSEVNAMAEVNAMDESLSATETAETETVVAGEVVSRFAVAEGTVIESVSTPDEIAIILEQITGPTDNLAGQLSRLAPFPNIPSPNDTEVLDVGFGVSTVGAILTVDFETSARAEDVVEELLADLTALGERNGSVEEFEQDGGTLFTGSVGEFSFQAASDADTTTANITFQTDDLRFLDDHQVRLAGVTEASPAVSAPVFVQANVAIVDGEIAVSSVWATAEMDGDDFRETEADRVDDLGWELISDGDFLRTYSTPGQSESAEVSVLQLGDVWQQVVTFNY